MQGSKCNPEASIEYKDGTLVNIEVKTPEFTDQLHKFDRYMPLILLNDEGDMNLKMFVKSRGICYNAKSYEIKTIFKFGSYKI